MTAYNKKTPARSRGTSPVRTGAVSTGVTYEGHPGYSRDPKSELFLLGTTQFMRQDAFYEKAKKRDDRFVSLVRQVAVEDPVWTLNFIRWLRATGNIRSAALVAGLEAARALLDLGADLGNLQGMIELKGQGIVRNLAKAGISRADEPGEALAYWTSKYGKNIPMPVKRAIADRVEMLYTERNLLKYDTDSHGFRFGDVIELTHPRPKAPQQSDLFKYAIERRHGRGVIPDSLGMLSWNALVYHQAAQNDYLNLLNPERLGQAGMTWEDVLSLAGSKLDKKLLWESMIPNMGYMALLRNLRNFDQAGVSDDHARLVIEKLSDPDQVARSKQLPMRFLSAYSNAPSLRWGQALEQALTLSLSNVPILNGRTLILVDTSGSMNNPFSDMGKLKRWDVASLFGIALGYRAMDPTVVSFSGEGWYQRRRSTTNQHRWFPLIRGEAWLRAWERWGQQGYNLNGGTDTVGAIHANFKDHNRVIIITDEQATRTYLNQVNEAIPANVPLHVIDVAGYEKGMVPSGSENRHVYGGLTDSVFTLIPTVEAGATGKWPWEQGGGQ